MNKVHAIVALSLGILASSSGVLQVQAATYNFFVDFSTKEVADFTAYRQTFNEDTYNLDNYIVFSFQGTYRYDSCPTAFTQNITWNLIARKNATGAFNNVAQATLPDFVCTTTNTPYLVNLTYVLSPTLLESLVNDDADFIEFIPEIRIANSVATNGRTLFLLGYQFYFELAYDFNTTYLFNYFLSDTKYNGRAQSGATWTFAGTQQNFLNYVFTTAGADSYYIYNSPSSNIGLTRKKYAIDYNAEFFRGGNVGAAFRTAITGTDTALFTSSTGNAVLNHFYHYYYLNVSNIAQPIVNVPLINFTTQSCSGGFLDINVGCFINNALAYLTNTAPIISDATALINAGINFAGQTFGIIGAFTTNNMFGYLVLGGFGFIVIKSVFKNDK